MSRIRILIYLFMVVLLSISSSTKAQECNRGPQLNLTVEEVKGEITKLYCGYIASDNDYKLYSTTETGSSLQVDFKIIRKISFLRDPEGKIIQRAPMDLSFLAIVELIDGASRRLYVNGTPVVGGYSSWGKQTFWFKDIRTIEFE